MLYKIEVKDKKGIFDAVGSGVLKDIIDLGISGVTKVEFIQCYYLEGKAAEADITRIAQSLLTDPITQEYIVFTCPLSLVLCHSSRAIEIAYNAGVMDPWEASIRKGIEDLGISGIDKIHTAKKYIFAGQIDESTIQLIAEKLLYNKLIQHVVKDTSSITSKETVDYQFNLQKVDLLKADDKELEKISKAGQLFLNILEMRHIRDYFQKLKRNPTDCELETIAQTWSEHCQHKTLRGKIEYTENGKKRKFENLLKETIMAVTRELDHEWCVSVFKDNAGVIRFDDQYDICFKVETHNHPSALEPYGGAATGIGGVIRDPLGTGLGAKPIANTDIFCFGKPDYPHDKLPPGILHPKRVMKGVVSGVRDYGNRMGIPTVNGAVLFDDDYLGNPLVYCGNIGLIPQGMSEKKVYPGDLVVVVGGKTGRDGIHGATFSSGELTTDSETVSSGAVQVGNPITEKKVVDTILEARDKKLFNAITDCGAGGLSSAVGEMGEESGARVDLDKVPLKYHGLSYWEIWISEAQERMVIAVSPEKIDQIMEIFQAENVEATIIGEFTDTKRLELFYQGNKVLDLDMEFLHGGVPKVVRKAVWNTPKYKEPDIKESKNLTADLKAVLADLNVASKEWVIRQYDHEVQAGSALKPLVGVNNDGPSDAAIVMPRLEREQGIAISCGINPNFGRIDPYWMAASVIDEAIRQIIAVGGQLEDIAILDNYCWGNTEKEEQLGSLVRASIACYDIAKYYGTPFISGKDSLNNEFNAGGKTISIPPTLLISAMGIIKQVKKTISMDAKASGNLIYIIGETKDEAGGSVWYRTKGELGINVPEVDKEKSKEIFTKLSNAINSGLVRSCHDLSEGGLAVGIAEMAFSGGLGSKINLTEVPAGKLKRNDKILFSESNSRFLIEVEPDKKEKLEKALAGIVFAEIGSFDNSKNLIINGQDNKEVINADINELKETWQAPLKW